MTTKHFSLFLGLRYLKPKRTFVSVITVISIVGVTLGVTMLVLVLAVMSGFERDMKKVILGFHPHVIVRSEWAIETWFTYKKRSLAHGIPCTFLSAMMRKSNDDIPLVSSLKF